MPERFGSGGARERLTTTCRGAIAALVVDARPYLSEVDFRLARRSVTDQILGGGTA
ncbi:hypothetical protein [Mycobacteroides franklinii]|uniref:hypothetical protein n=1 Tax=Mycobacteroides franklinii TaxID=948102 RepID=UPI0012FFC655|nr:hypothetical protein [Mycobacteroides franklinii]